jgi:hypothetical protein
MDSRIAFGLARSARSARRMAPVMNGAARRENPAGAPRVDVLAPTVLVAQLLN